MGHVANQIKGNNECRTYSVLTHTLDPWDGRNIFFLKVILLHIKFINGNGVRSAMQAHILSLHTFSTPGVGSNHFFFIFLAVMLHIKLKGMELKAPCKHLSCPYTHNQSQDGVKRSKHFFSESSHVAYQNKGNGA